MRMRSLLVLPATVLLLACSEDEHSTGDEPITPHLDELSTALSALSSETSSHETSMSAITSTASIHMIEMEHHDRAVGHIGAVEAGCAEMQSMCVDQHGMEVDAGTMLAVAAQMKQEMDNHHASMNAAADLAAASNEESRHQAAFASLKNQLQASRDALAQDADMYVCHHDAH